MGPEKRVSTLPGGIVLGNPPGRALLPLPVFPGQKRIRCSKGLTSDLIERCRILFLHSLGSRPHHDASSGQLLSLVFLAKSLLEAKAGLRFNTSHSHWP